MSPLNLFRSWRERGLESIDAAGYAAAWQRYGGSVMTHPGVVATLSGIADIPVRYLARRSAEGEIVGALATWGRDLALSRRGLKRRGKKRVFDLGNAEIILPIDRQARFDLRFAGDYISGLHADRVDGLRRQGEALAMVRPLADYGKKFLYNQRRELRLFLEAGGEVRDVHDFPAETLSGIYTDLFEKRWGFPVPAKPTLPEVLRYMQTFMTGSLLLHQGRPIAFQLIYRVDSPGWLSVEYINGGIDPGYEAYSPGSILCYLNIQAAHAAAEAAGKALRYSFGRADQGYKMRWCHPVPVYRCR